ncbi:MAG: cache domain-containing protein [Lentisphaeria bacterium]
MLKFKLFKSTALIVILFAVLAALLGMHTIQSRVISEAQDRVRLDLNSAWAVYNSKLREINTVLQLAAARQDLKATIPTTGRQVDDQEAGKAENNEAPLPKFTPPAPREWKALRYQLNKTRVQFNLDFLSVTDHRGRVVMRTANPEKVGDFAPTKGAVLKAIEGEPATETVLFAPSQLRRENAALEEQAYLQLRKTPKARPTPRNVEDRGMVMLAAVPVKQAGKVVGTVYGGVLLNRNKNIVDNIHSVVYEADKEQDSGPLAAPGTVTIFLHDTRIATTVRTEHGNRAYGTRVSTEVANTVLENNRNWIGRAFVVNDWYLTAYGPVQNLDEEVVGMLYVGILEEPYKELGRNVLLRFALLGGLALLGALAVAFFMAGRLSSPLHRLSAAARKMQRGEFPEEVPVEKHASRETKDLVDSFNTMAASLQTREAQLRQANRDLEKANDSLNVMNRNYMETVEFVTHELKRPVASMVNYVYMLDQQLLGELNEKQQKAISSLHRNLNNFSEMIRHYLNLARIENDELSPKFSKTNVNDDIISSAIEDVKPDADEKNMTIENRTPDNIVCSADVNMLREVFDNLLSNAVKYGRDNGIIRISGKIVNETEAEFAVWNEGQGIAEDKLKDLFQKFSRLEGGEHQKQKGTGLGLFISKQIVAAHKGRMEVDSESGQWAEFRFVIPVNQETETKK